MKKRANTDEAIEAIFGANQLTKKLRRSLKLQEEKYEERIDIDDISQFQVVSHKPQSNEDNFYENFKTNANIF